MAASAKVDFKFQFEFEFALLNSLTFFTTDLVDLILSTLSLPLPLPLPYTLPASLD